jgi:amino acid adenylation domain-containing protein
MDLARRVPGGHIVLPVDLTDPDDGPTQPPAVQVGPDNLAYVSYTSGSTGEPKGVSVPHRAVARLVSAPDWATLGPDDVFLQAAPVAFDAATLEIWAPLCNGGRLALLPAGQLDIEQVAETIRAEGVSVLWLTAGLFNQVIDGHLDQLGGVRHLIAGGDVVSPDAVTRLLAAHPHLVFSNGYGPTENTTFTTCATIRAPYQGGPVPIGRAISGTRVAVLDPDLRPVPIGVAGELYAGGAGLARGYLGRPGATAQRFLPDPAGSGERLYRTGDLVRWRADGMLEFLGRADRQVKVNGYRIEPAEIESALLANANVRAAAVLAAESAGGKRLVGYVVPVEAALDDGGLPSELRSWLRERLPGYLVPARIVALEEFPLTPNGKLDRAALPELNRAPRNVPNDYIAPNTHLERLLCDLWGDALGIADIGTDDDFFELGGHSLIAAELLARLQQEFGIELSARTLYLSPTVGELAELTELDSALVKQTSE